MTWLVGGAGDLCVSSTVWALTHLEVAEEVIDLRFIQGLKAVHATIVPQFAGRILAHGVRWFGVEGTGLVGLLFACVLFRLRVDSRRRATSS